MSNPIVHAISLAVLVSIVIAVVRQLWDGDPELVQSVVTGVAIGITVAALHHWKNNKKTNSDKSD